MSQNPQVTIGIPVFNGETYLREALESARNQTFTQIRFLLCDNASTDSTPDICREYVARDSRFEFHPAAKNGGAAFNYNRAFALSESPYFMWLAHDDRLDPTFVERAHAELESHPDVGLCYAPTRFIDGAGNFIEDFADDTHLDEEAPVERFRRFLKHHSEMTYCNPIFGLFRYSVLERTNVIGTFPGSDMILLGEIALGSKIHELRDCRFERREHDGRSIRASKDARDLAEWFLPGSGKKRRYRACRWLLEYTRAIGRAPLSPSERARCLAALRGGYIGPYKERMALEVRTELGFWKRAALGWVGLSRGEVPE